MSTELDSYDRAIHSDFLLHWTGKDIDQEHNRNWYKRTSSKTSPDVTNRYLGRLLDMLTHGLWMTEENAETFNVGGKVITIPSTPRCCFTELRLSEARRHAARYGRLAIGVKRPFLFNRLGRPLSYFGYGGRSIHDKFFETCAEDLKDKKFLNFFKPMNADADKLVYELYAESEWRILYFKELLEDGRIVDPRDKERNPEAYAYLQGLPPESARHLKFLVPLDGWLCFIVYPSLAVKNEAQWHESYAIRKALEKIKLHDDHANRTEGVRERPPGNLPIEIDLDACRHL